MKKTNYLSFLGLFLCLPAWADDFLQLKTFEHLHLKKEAFAYAKTLQQPDVDTQVLITKIYLENNQYQKANALINQILQNYPQDSDAYLLKIIYFEKQEHFKEALNWTEIALLFYPFNTEFYPIKWRLAQVLQTSKKTITTPLDVDAALKSAQAELKNNHYAKVCPLLTPYIQQYPKYIDLYLVCIQAHIQMKAYSKGLALTQKGLIYAPKHLVLLKKQADLKYLMNQKSKEKVKAIEKASIPQTAIYLNELGVFDQLYYISDRKQLWDYTTVFYGRQTELGKVYGKVNYANRLKKEALQYEVEFFPKLGKYVYLDLDASVANQPILFPKYNYGGEAYVVLPKLFDFSVGEQFNRITSNLQFNRMTASVTKELIQGLNTTFRSYMYFPGSGQNSIFYTLNLRHMFIEPYLYAGMIIGSGTTPDLANLETINFLVLKNKIMLSPYINFAAFHDQFIFNFSFLYQNQVFPNQRQREWVGGTMGATWRF